MVFHFSAYPVALIINAAFAILVTGLLWPRRAIPGGLPLALLMLAVAEWSLTDGLQNAAVGTPTKVFWSKVSYLGITSSPVLLFTFALEYSHIKKWLTRRNLILLFAIPVITLIMAITNEWHRLVWSSFTPSPVPDSNILIYGHGAWFWVAVSYIYILLSTAIIILIWTTIRFQHIYRRQAIALLIGVPLPVFSNVLYVLDFGPIRGMDFTPLAFMLTGLILTLGIYRLQLFDLVPVARDKLIEDMSDGVLVLDTKNRIVDINPAAQRLIQSSGSSLIGQPIEVALAANADLVSRYRDVMETQTEINVGGNEPRYLDVRIYPLYDRGKRFTGRLFVLREITERRKSEEAEVKARRIAEALQETSLAISSTLEFNRILNMILEQIGYVLVFDNASISLVQGDEFVLIALRGFERVEGLVGSRWPLEGSPNLQVLQERRPVNYPDIEADFSLYYQLPRDTIRSMLMIPLFYKDLVVGFLNLGSEEQDHFTAEDEHVAAAFAAQVAVALENSRLYEESQRLATIDTLTGLYNRRQFFFLAEKEIERARRYNKQLAVIMVDLDQFKAINDTYGHLVGDQVLRAVAKACNQALRKVDIVGRYGGEEFTIILPEIGLEGAKYVAERLRTLIAAIEIKTDQGLVKVTISQGLAASDEKHNTLEILLERADKALYTAKSTGGNQVVLYD